MSTTKTPDLSKAVLFLGSFVGVDDILKMSENSRYEFQPPATDADISWRGGQCKEELKPPILCLMIGEHLFDPRGWVIGSHSDSDECDLQVAKNNQTGISRRFIRVDISPVTHNPRVTVLSGRTIRIRDGDRILICRPGEPTEFSRPVTVDLGQVSFRAWPPMRSNTAREYQKWANVFSKDILLAVPKYLPSINGQLETATHNVRYGRNDAVYVNEVGLGSESKGMSASVFMVKDRTTGNIFGAKEPYYRTSDNHDTARKRFEALQKEYEHIMQLDHPHVVKAYDLVLAEDVTLPPWMIVEYIPQNLLEAQPDFDERERQRVLTHLSSALHHMHANTITHRDVKPDNALVQGRGQELTIKLADFGTSKHNAAGKMDTFTGTLIYMAPELFKKPRRYTDKVDMWSLGLIGMQLFTTWNPASDGDWDPNGFGPWMRKVIIPRVVDAPQQLRPLLKGLLRKDPKRRWSAWECLEWLWRLADDVYVPVGGPTDTNDRGSVNYKKRPASTLDEDDHDRWRRSLTPSVSTARVRPVPLAEHRSEKGSTLPNTLSPGPWVVEPISAAPTPHPDDRLFDVGGGEAEDFLTDSDAGLEDDWKEDDS